MPCGLRMSHHALLQYQVNMIVIVGMCEAYMQGQVRDSWRSMSVNTLCAMCNAFCSVMCEWMNQVIGVILQCVAMVTGFSQTDGSSWRNQCLLCVCGYRISILFTKFSVCFVGWDSSVDIATCHGLDGPGIESQQGRDFLYLSRLALGPTQPPIQRAACVFPGGKVAGVWH